ncbi:phosphomethylpyrimidine kinase THI20 [Histoplasma capsulatum G186AR]|uniref:Phosphomethylpyrimidine kinase THI20 n=2 Tax=Ajellomyces capsulatus TaxID=5037 RepID=C0NXA7_AJECG|nr:phosphomethylpyrimidine kinase THI20 [Histoplasma capsulatum G186AR]EEH03973.1 phosphomethylpyrimidine kinase THI20 [Histoplasma capsulatum G186AR]
MKLKRVLVIAGSDSSGGAGLEADQRVLTAHGCYALTATTALTAQNTLGVQDIHVVPVGFVRKQINAGLEDVGADVVKLGMLASAETAEMVADTLWHHKVSKVVLDPVMVSTSGSELLPAEAVNIVQTKLLPLTTIVTPNIPEAILLLQGSGAATKDPENLEDAIQIAKQIHTLGPKYVLLKGGHMPRTCSRSLASSRISCLKNTHGTGCSLASAIAANLAQGMDVVRAVRAACRFVEAGIRTSVDMGKGNGPINHFHSVYSLPFAPGRFVEYILDRPDVQPVWKAFTEHEFVAGLGKGTLPVEKFKGYLIQDYHYLIHFARSNALAASKHTDIDGISMSAQIVLHVQREMNLHLDYCATFGLTKQDIENCKESLACVAYSRYILDIGQSEDWLALQVALSPCLIGYGAIAKRLHCDENTAPTGNRYWKWIENYVAEDYVKAVEAGSELLERHMRDVSPTRMEELIKIFIRATELEIGFWDMGLKADQL